MKERVQSDRNADESGPPSIFLDTSIMIARVVHSSKAKAAISRRLRMHGLRHTGLVVRQEFKRRLLKEASYLLAQLHHRGSLSEVVHHLIRMNMPYNARKKAICLETIEQIHGGSDRERTDRAKLYLRSLLNHGLARFDQYVDVVAEASGCELGQLSVKEVSAFKQYEFGPSECQKAKSCGVLEFLMQSKVARGTLLSYLECVPDNDKSEEIKRAEAFLKKINEGEMSSDENPCLRFGDLMIALESIGVSHFFTLNGTESQHLCRPLDQTLIVQPVDPLKCETVCGSREPVWPKFGR